MTSQSFDLWWLCKIKSTSENVFCHPRLWRSPLTLKQPMFGSMSFSAMAMYSSNEMFSNSSRVGSKTGIGGISRKTSFVLLARPVLAFASDYVSGNCWIGGRIEPVKGTFIFYSSSYFFATALSISLPLFEFLTSSCPSSTGSFGVWWAVSDWLSSILVPDPFLTYISVNVSYIFTFIMF